MSDLVDEEERVGGVGLFDLLGFFLSGVVNNTSYVIMLAGAKHLDASMVGLIYVLSVGPSFLVKLTGPYWFHFVPYRPRIWLCALVMALSFLFVAIGDMYSSNAMILFGVSIGSAGSGVGEASFLALSSFYNPSRKVLTAWSSGTGFAGIFGYAWVVFFTVAIKTSFAFCCFVGMATLPPLFVFAYEVLLRCPTPEKMKTGLLSDDASADSTEEAALKENSTEAEGGTRAQARPDNSAAKQFKSSSSPSSTSPMMISSSAGSSSDGSSSSSSSDDIVVDDKEVSNSNRSLSNAEIRREASKMNATTHELSSKERVDAVLKLWPYMIPLCSVYFAEYALQSGVWAAMGFPVTSSDARAEFYEYANWVYQAGVVVSRSSGYLWLPTKPRLWILPGIQWLFFAFSLINAYQQWWYDWSYLIMCFCVGLIGGSVYVMRIDMLCV